MYTLRKAGQLSDLDKTLYCLNRKVKESKIQKRSRENLRMRFFKSLLSRKT